MTISIDLPWLALATILLIVTVVVATLRWSGRITRGRHAFHDENFSVQHLARQLDTSASPIEPRNPWRTPHRG